MYGIINLNNGEETPSAEFRSGLGKYGRGSACKGCRISRVRCSGKLDGRDCDRCKRLEKPCSYTNSQNQRQRLSNQPLDSNQQSTTSTTAASPMQTNSDTNSSGSSPLAPTSCDEGQFAADDTFELDLNMWLQLQKNSPGIEPPRLHTESAAPLSRTELPDPLFFPALQSEESREDGDTFETSSSRIPGLGHNGFGEDEVAGYDADASGSLMDFQDWTSNPPGVACQEKCLQAITSSLYVLREWTWDGRPEVDLGKTANSSSFNYAKVENFLTLFRKSMAQLQAVENCPLGCIRSQELAMLLLLVIEQLAKLLVSLAADSALGSGEASPNVAPTPCAPGIYISPSSNSRPGEGIRLARIGSFEIQDPLDLQRIMKLLLQSRIQALDAYICRWNDKIKQDVSKSLKADLRSIRQRLSRVVFCKIF